MTRPNPWQAAQAPSGELNAKSAGVGSRNSAPQRGQWSPRRKVRDAVLDARLERAGQRERGLGRGRDLGPRVRAATTKRPDDERADGPPASSSGVDVVADLDGLALRRQGPEESGALELGQPRRVVRPRFRRRPAAAASASLQATGRHEHRPRAVLGRAELLDRAVDAARHGRDAAVGAERRAAVGEEQPQRVVDLGLRPDGRAGVADAVLLLERDRRRHGLDRVHVRPVQPLQELARVGRQRLGVAALPLGVERVEGERRLARARDAR